MDKKTHDYRSITFRLDMNNALEQQLYAELEKKSIKLRNRLIKDALIREFIANGCKSESPDNHEMRDILSVIYKKIGDLEKRMELPPVPAPMPEPVVAVAEPKAEPVPAEPKEVPAEPKTPPESEVIADEPEVSQEALAFLANGGFL